MNEKEQLQKIVSENPDPAKWSKWVKVAIRILVIILSAVLGDGFDVNDILTSLI